MNAPIEIHDLHVTLGARPVLQGVSATMNQGELIGLVGPNGAGKSTLLRAIAGLVRMTSGSINLAGNSLQTLSQPERAAHLAYLPQSRPVAWNINAEDLAALGRFAGGAGPYAGCGQADKAAIDAALAKAGAAGFRGRAVQTLSGGEQARVHLARVLASEAASLLLDEPCAALDIGHQLGLMATLKRECEAGRSVIAALHDLPLAARFCDRIIVLETGRVIADDAPEAALSGDVLGQVFGVSRGPGGFLRC